LLLFAAYIFVFAAAMLWFF